MRDEIDACADISPCGGLLHAASQMKGLGAEIELLWIIDMSGEQSLLRRAEAYAVRQLCLGDLATGRFVDKQSIALLHALHRQLGAIMKPQPVPLAEGHAAKRRRGESILS